MIAFFSLLEREIRRFMKVFVQTVITPFMNSFLYLLIFGVSMGVHMADYHGEKYLAFLIPGIMVMGLINNAFANSSSSIITSKFSGDLEDWRVAPITDHNIIWALNLGAVVRGSFVAVVNYIVGTLFYYSQTQQWLVIKHPFYLVFFLLMGGLIFAQIGIAVAFWAKTFDQVSAISAFLLTPLTYLGGVFISIDHLSPFWQSASLWNPLLYLINGFRYGLLGVSDVDVHLAMGVSLLGFILFYFLAFWCLKKGSFQRW